MTNIIHITAEVDLPLDTIAAAINKMVQSGPFYAPSKAVYLLAEEFSEESDGFEWLPEIYSIYDAPEGSCIFLKDTDHFVIDTAIRQNRASEVFVLSHSAGGEEEKALSHLVFAAHRESGQIRLKPIKNRLGALQEVLIPFA
jgi:hypothetical protein